MTFIDAVLLYLLLFRVAIVVSAIVSLILGYRLFCKGIGVAHGSETGSNIESSIAGARLAITNAAPGTAFALFGAILIVVMLIQSSPSVTWESMSKWKPSSAAPGQAESEQSNKIVMRGNGQDAIVSLTTRTALDAPTF